MHRCGDTRFAAPIFEARASPSPGANGSGPIIQNRFTGKFPPPLKKFFTLPLDLSACSLMIARYSLSRSLMMKRLKIVERASLQNIFLQKEEWTFLCRITNQKHKNNNTFTHSIRHIELNQSHNQDNRHRCLHCNQGNQSTRPSQGNRRCFLSFNRGNQWYKRLLPLSRDSQC